MTRSPASWSATGPTSSSSRITWPTRTAGRSTGPGGRVTRRMRTISVTSWSGGTSSSTPSRTGPLPPSGASSGCSGRRGWTWARARPASGIRCSRCWGRQGRRCPRPFWPVSRCPSAASARRPTRRRPGDGGGLGGHPRGRRRPAPAGRCPPAWPSSAPTSRPGSRRCTRGSRSSRWRWSAWRSPCRPIRSSARFPGWGPPSPPSSSPSSGTSPGTTKFSQLRKLAGLDIQRVESGQWAGTARISRGGRALLRWALYQAAMGACRNAGWRARREALIAKRRGDRFAFFKANTELAAKLLRLVWGVWRSGRPYDPARVDGGPAARPAIAAPRARAGRRAAPPSGQGQAASEQPRSGQSGRMAGTQASRAKSGTRRRA